MKEFRRQTTIAVFIAIVIAIVSVSARPKPGDIFREYIHSPYPWIRVGIRAEWDYGGKKLPLLPKVDLTNAVRAEISVQKLQCHTGTRNLAVSINDGAYQVFPEAAKIPSPQVSYQHMFYPSIPVDLKSLKSGVVNTCRLKLHNMTNKWMQNIVYGVVLRVYYSGKAPHPLGRITSPLPNASIGKDMSISVQAQSATSKVKRVDLVGHYEDFNYEGDGEYRQWHYHFLQNKLCRHIGTDSVAPFSVSWNTRWIPDQSLPVKIAARIQDETGMIYMTPAIDGLKLVRPGFSVKMYKPINVPQKWVTRTGNQFCNFSVPVETELGKINSAQMVFVCWDPKWIPGINMNAQKACGRLDMSEDVSGYLFNRIDVSPTLIKSGLNKITTLVSEHGHHGTEIQWPGIAVIAQFGEAGTPFISSRESQGVGALSGQIGSVRTNENGRVTVQFIGPLTFNSNIQVWNAMGQRVGLIPAMAGARMAVWDGSQRAQSVLFLRCLNGTERQSQRVFMLR